MRRATIALVLLAAAALPAGAAPPAGGPDLAALPDASQMFDGLGGGAQQDSSLLRGLRQLRDGSVPEGTVLLGDPPPEPLTNGVSVTLDVLDLDDDGVEELLQVRGTITKPKLAVTDGATGVPDWERSMSTYAFATRTIPDGTHVDLLVFIDGQVQRLDGDTGALLWSRGLPGGSVGYWGTAPSSTGGDFVLGSFSIPYPQVLELRLEFRSLATGNVLGTHVVQGEGDYPTAALAGDQDGDGIGDLFTLTPTYAFSATSGGLLRAVGGRGTKELWVTPFSVEVTDNSYLVDGSDVTGDGRGDAVIFSEWLGLDGGTRTEDIITVVDGRGGTLAGLQPVTQVVLQHFPDLLTTPGDLNGDGGADLIFSGPVYHPSDGTGHVAFEAIGKSGRLWKATAGWPTPISEFRWGWWPAAGDLDGDGIEDALALVGDTQGPARAVGISQRAGATLWVRDGLAGGFNAPLYADANGDGSDDVADRLSGGHPDSTTTRFSYTIAGGRDLAPMWSRTVTVDSGYPSWTIYLNGGHIDPASGEDLVIEYVQGGPGRHRVESLHGPTGSVKWAFP